MPQTWVRGGPSRSCVVSRAGRIVRDTVVYYLTHLAAGEVLELIVYLAQAVQAAVPQ